MSVSLYNVQSLVVSALGALLVGSLFLSAAVGPATMI